MTCPSCAALKERIKEMGYVSFEKLWDNLNKRGAEHDRLYIEFRATQSLLAAKTEELDKANKQICGMWLEIEKFKEESWKLK